VRLWVGPASSLSLRVRTMVASTSMIVSSPAGPAPAAHAAARAVARAPARRRYSSGPRPPMVRHAVGWDATGPNRAGWSRNAARSDTHSAPSARATIICARVTPGSWRRRGSAAIASLRPAVRPLRSAISPSHTSPACDTSPSPSPVTVRGRTSLVACPIESPPELGSLDACFDTRILPGQEGFSRAQQAQL
jgi:hypothetical protein